MQVYCKTKTCAHEKPQTKPGKTKVSFLSFIIFLKDTRTSMNVFKQFQADGAICFVLH